MSTLAFDQLISRCWAQGLLESRDYYYNKDVPNLQSKSADFLPNHIDLSDTWVVAIVNFKLSQEDRGVLWSCVFSVKGLLRAEFVHKRQASKMFDTKAKVFRYALLFGKHNMFSSKGYDAGLPPQRANPIENPAAVAMGLVAQLQTVQYDTSGAHEEAKSA